MQCFCNLYINNKASSKQAKANLSCTIKGNSDKTVHPVAVAFTNWFPYQSLHGSLNPSIIYTT